MKIRMTDITKSFQDIIYCYFDIINKVTDMVNWKLFSYIMKFIFTNTANSILDRINNICDISKFIYWKH